MRDIQLAILAIALWGCGNGSGNTEPVVDLTADSSTDVDGRTGPADVPLPDGLSDESAADALLVDELSVDETSVDVVDAFPDAPDALPEVEDVDVVLGQCTSIANFVNLACNQPADRCTGMSVEWGEKFEFKLCVSSTELHAGGCTGETRAALVIDRTARVVGEATLPIWSRQLLYAELWSESGEYLRNLKFMDILLSDCPTHVLEKETCGAALVTVDRTLEPLDECVANGDYLTTHGGCLFDNVHLKQDPSWPAEGIFVNLVPGKYEVRLVFCPTFDSGLCGRPIEFFEYCAQEEFPGTWPPEVPLVPTQQFISVWVEVLD